MVTEELAEWDERAPLTTLRRVMGGGEGLGGSGRAYLKPHYLPPFAGPLFHTPARTHVNRR